MTIRVLPLEGGRNFRDLGGYVGDGGRTVRWGRLFRSGTMSALTSADYDYLSKFGVVTICDLRTALERDSEPTQWLGDRVPAIYAHNHQVREGHALANMSSPEMTAEVMRETMGVLYTQLPYQHIESYRRLFGEMLAGNTPLIFNCSAGKDRTGVAAGLILTALGVPRGDILIDYSLSEQIVDFEAVSTRAAAASATTGFSFIGRLSKDVRAPILRSDPAYLEAAFEEMERREGSAFGYLEAHLGVGKAEVEALRDALLEG
jgi:protein-tyrosine phosphatase